MLPERLNVQSEWALRFQVLCELWCSFVAAHSKHSNGARIQSSRNALTYVLLKLLQNSLPLQSSLFVGSLVHPTTVWANTVNLLELDPVCLALHFLNPCTNVEPSEQS